MIHLVNRQIGPDDALRLLALKLFREGRREFEIPISMIMDAQFDDLAVKVIRFQDKNCYLIKLYSNSGAAIEDAEYEIESEQKALSSPPKLLDSGNGT